MDLTKFGSGSVDIWIFFVFAAAVILLSMIPIQGATRSSLGSYIRPWYIGDQLKGRGALPRLKSHLLVCVRLAYFSPYYAMLFALFALAHSRWTVATFCQSVGLMIFEDNPRTGDSQPRSSTLWMLEDEDCARPGLFPSFRKNIAKEISNFVGKVGWDDESFFRRILKKLKLGPKSKASARV